jgi:hypothetical protein
MDSTPKKLAKTTQEHNAQFYRNKTALKIAEAKLEVIARAESVVRELEYENIHPIDTVSPGCDGCDTSSITLEKMKEVLENPIQGISSDLWARDFAGESVLAVLRRHDHLVSIGTLSNLDVTCQSGARQSEAIADFVREARHCVTTDEKGPLLKATDVSNNGFKVFNLMVFNTEEGAQTGERLVKELLEGEAGCWTSQGWLDLQKYGAAVPTLSSGIFQWDWNNSHYDHRPGKLAVEEGFMSLQERAYADETGPRVFTTLFISLLECCDHEYNSEGEMVAACLGKSNSTSRYAKRVAIRPGSEEYIRTKDRIATYIQRTTGANEEPAAVSSALVSPPSTHHAAQPAGTDQSQIIALLVQNQQQLQELLIAQRQRDERVFQQALAGAPTPVGPDGAARHNSIVTADDINNPGTFGTMSACEIQLADKQLLNDVNNLRQGVNCTIAEYTDEALNLYTKRTTHAILQHYPECLWVDIFQRGLHIEIQSRLSPVSASTTLQSITTEALNIGSRQSVAGSVSAFGCCGDVSTVADVVM